MKLASLLLAALSLPVMAASPYVVPSKDYKDKASHVITNFPVVRTQDGTGLCYAFTATNLVNHHYCKTAGLDCSKEENQLSVLHIASMADSFNGGIFNEGGDTQKLLLNVKARAYKGIQTEKCLPFEKLSHQKPQQWWERQDQRAQEYHNQGRLSADPREMGLLTIDDVYEATKNRVSPDQKLCYANWLKSVLPINKSIEEVVKALDAFTAANLAYNLVVKGECPTSDRVFFPDFAMQVYPKRNSTKKATYESTVKQLEKLILNDIPVALKYCDGNEFDPDIDETCEGHGTTITGIKEVCSPKGCKTLIKIQNSYGQAWQDEYNDGWVEARPIFERAVAYSDTMFLSWITSYTREEDIPKASLKRVGDISAEATEKLVRKDKRFAKPKPLTTNQARLVPPADIDMDRDPMFMCPGGVFTEAYREGCKLFKYQK